MQASMTGRDQTDGPDRDANLGGILDTMTSVTSRWREDGDGGMDVGTLTRHEMPA